MNLEEALVKIEEVTKENKKLRNRVTFLEDMLYNDTLENYNANEVDDYDPIFD